MAAILRLTPGTTTVKFFTLKNFAYKNHLYILAMAIVIAHR